MKVQQVKAAAGMRYILLDDNYQVVEEVKRYLKYLDTCGESPNTLRAYAYDLLLYYRYASEEGFNIKDLCNDPDRKPIDTLSGFMMWLQYPKTAGLVFHFEKEDASRKNRSVNRILGTVLSFYEYLSANDELPELDIYKRQRQSGKFKSFLSEMYQHKKEKKTSILTMPVPDRKVRATTREEYEQIINACNTRRDKILVALLFECGLRLCEALGIHLCDLSRIDQGELDIIPRENNENGARVKNYAEGTVILPAYLIDMIVDYMTDDVADADSDFLLLTDRGKNKGRPMTPGNAEQLFIRLTKKTGMKVHPHMLRHGFAQEKLDNGWELEEVQAYLRHKNVASTAIYAQYKEEKKREKMRGFLDKKKDELNKVGCLLI